MFSQNTFTGEKLKAQLEMYFSSYVLFIRVMYFSSYGALKFTQKSAQNAIFAVNHTLRWNNSNLITNWETILTVNNYMDEMNSEIISRFQVPRPN